MNLKTRLPLIGLCLLLVAAGVWMLRPGKPGTPSPEPTRASGASNAIPATAISKKSPSRPEPLPATEETLRALEQVLAGPVTLDRSGPLDLARDELYLREADGAHRIVSIPATSDPAAFLAEVSKVRAESGQEPELVLYPPSTSRTPYTRRIVTRDVLISAADRKTADALATAAGLEFKSAPAYAPGRFVYTAENSIHALAFHFGSADAENASTRPLLASRAQTMSALPNDRYFQKQWHLAFQNQFGAVENTDINVTSVWNYPSTDPASYIRGNGTTIGIIDDGLEWTHSDLRPNVRIDRQWDWIGKDNDPTPPYPLGVPVSPEIEPFAHGTACGGVAAARGNNLIGVSGVAPEAGLVGLRLLGAPVTELDEAEAMTWRSQEIDIKNNSWGYINPFFPMAELTEEALQYATSFGRQGRGTIFTFSAGNSDDTNRRPDYRALQNSIYTICVAAMSSRGVKSDYSESGASVVVSAPSNNIDSSKGLGIMTTDHRGRYGYNIGTFVSPLLPLPNDFLGDNDVTMNFGGTSSACPVVSGVVALMLQRNPNLGWRDVQEILMRSAAQVDVADPEWITANRTDHVTGNKTVEFHFNHKYGAGLVDAAAAVALAGSWTNLGGQIAQTYTPVEALPVSIPDNLSTGTSVKFHVNGANLRVEHATLKISVSDVPTGQLEIKLTSPNGTESIFCEASNGVLTPLTDWTFNTVRSWAEDSTGNWTLTVADRAEGFTGSITSAELTVYGTALASRNPPPGVNLAPSSNWVFAGTPVTLNATTSDLKSDGTPGIVSRIALIPPGNQTISGNLTRNASSAIWTWTPPAAGNYSFTLNATDSEGASRVSNPVSIRVDAPLIAGWDFQTITTQSPTALQILLQTGGNYSANFGGNNGTTATLHHNGTAGSSSWSFNAGQISVGTGTTLNLGPGFAGTAATPSGLTLRAGTGLLGNEKALTFKFNMTGNRRLRVSYDTSASVGGFTSQVWEASANGTTWSPVQTVSLAEGSTRTVSLNLISALNNAPNAHLRVRFSGATRSDGTSTIDNIRFNATPTP